MEDDSPSNESNDLQRGRPERVGYQHDAFHECVWWPRKQALYFRLRNCTHPLTVGHVSNQVALYFLCFKIARGVRCWEARNFRWSERGKHAKVKA